MAKNYKSISKNAQRDSQILAFLEENGHATVNELCKNLYVSEATMRRALSNLARKGLINRTHGGAELLKTFSHAGPFSSRILLNAAAKRDIARKAATLVPDGSLVILDQSSTCYHLAEALMDKRDLTVVTNNLEIAQLLSSTNFEVRVSGGQLCNASRICMVGEDAQQLFLNICADFAFFSSRSLSKDGIISDCNRDEVNVRIAMFKHAKYKVFLCDSSKFSSTSGYIQSHLQDVDILISEDNTAATLAHRFPSLKCL